VDFSPRMHEIFPLPDLRVQPTLQWISLCPTFGFNPQLHTLPLEGTSLTPSARRAANFGVPVWEFGSLASCRWAPASTRGALRRTFRGEVCRERIGCSRLRLWQSEFGAALPLFWAGLFLDVGPTRQERSRQTSVDRLWERVGMASRLRGLKSRDASRIRGSGGRNRFRTPPPQVHRTRHSSHETVRAAHRR